MIDCKRSKIFFNEKTKKHSLHFEHFSVKNFLYIISLTMLLSGCMNKQTNFVNSTSKNHHSKSSYHFRDKTYNVLASSKNYNEIGVASWYGKHFHKRRTSSGERYNMYGMTAAHKTLPLSTYVLVTNLANGKKVLVKVNDRGPFTSNRLIDLSYAAAKKIGILHSGMATVSVKAVAHA